ncbi:MAG: DUF1501 domain-containing protein [Opitutaceae bacterium]
MKNPSGQFPYTRREFLGRGVRGLSLIAFSGFAPGFLTRSLLAGNPQPGKDSSILVLVQLAGGNDGLNTIIPFEDDRYFRLRPTLAIPKTKSIPIGGLLGLHPELSDFRPLLDDGKLAILQNVGYPNPNRSHFRSTEIWESAAGSDDFLPTGWLGRFFDARCAGMDGPAGIHLSTETPPSFLGAAPHETFGLPARAGRGRSGSTAKGAERALLEQIPEAGSSNLTFLKHTMLDAIVTEEKIQSILAGPGRSSLYPESGLGGSLRNIATLIAADLPTRVYFVSLGGFDTHSNQAATHGDLLRTLAEAMRAFQADLEAKGVADRVLTMTFSEFGRRPAENNGRGTDHGTAAPLFVMGSSLHGGIHGDRPDLDLQPKSDLEYSIDFRGIYARILDRWLDCPSEAELGGKFDAPEFV